MVRVLGVSKSGYYAWRKRPQSKRHNYNTYLIKEIKKAYQKSHRNYGSPRIYQDLKEQGIPAGRHRVARLMREHYIVARTKKRYKRYTATAHGRTHFDNLVQKNFLVDQPNRLWASDITMLWTGSGFLHVAVVMDLFSRRIIGWSMNSRITDDLTINALRMAVGARKPKQDLIHHSDQGSQYQSARFKKQLDKYRITGSMSYKGDCYDNAVVESFFKTLKSEWTKHNRYTNREEAMNSIFEFIEIYYNRQRRHSTLNYVSPVNFEKKQLQEKSVY